MSKQIAPSASPLSRPPLERMLRIHQAINSGKRPNATTLALSEHVTRVILSTTNATNIDSGFSFTTITRTGDGDDDGSNNRTVQGSLRQFIQMARNGPFSFAPMSCFN